MPGKIFFAPASSKFVSEKRGQGPKADESRSEAIPQAKKNWIHVPNWYSSKCELREGGELILVDPAFRCGIHQVGKLRAVQGFKRSSTNQANFAKTPINLPSWSRIAQMCMLFDMKGGSLLLAITEADRADA